MKDIRALEKRFNFLECELKEMEWEMDTASRYELADRISDDFHHSYDKLSEELAEIKFWLEQAWKKNYQSVSPELDARFHEEAERDAYWSALNFPYDDGYTYDGPDVWFA